MCSPRNTPTVRPSVELTAQPSGREAKFGFSTVKFNSPEFDSRQITSLKNICINIFTV